MTDLKNIKDQHQPRQGEIWLFDPEPTKGKEIGKKIRPCIVISNNVWNKISTGLVIVVPVTSKKKEISTHVQITPPEGSLAIESFALCEHIRSISRERLIKKMGIVSKTVLKEVLSWVSDLISLEG